MLDRPRHRARVRWAGGAVGGARSGRRRSAKFQNLTVQECGRGCRSVCVDGLAPRSLAGGPRNAFTSASPSCPECRLPCDEVPNHQAYARPVRSLKPQAWTARRTWSRNRDLVMVRKRACARSPQRRKCNGHEMTGEWASPWRNRSCRSASRFFRRRPASARTRRHDLRKRTCVSIVILRLSQRSIAYG